MSADRDRKGISFDLFGTLVTVAGRGDPAAAVAAELARRDVSVPEDWREAYTESHRSARPGEEVALTDHVLDVLRRSVPAGTSAPDRSTVRAALLAAFDREVVLVDGATRAVTAAARHGPVGLLSNCSVGGLVERTLSRTALDPTVFDAVVASVDIGWRKPHTRAYDTIAAELGVPASALLHVGDTPETDGGAEAVGATWVDVTETTLPAVATMVEERAWP